MIGYVLAACVMVVGVLAIVALARAALDSYLDARDLRVRRALRQVRVADAQRAAREREAARGTQPQRAPRLPPAVGLTAAIEKLEQSARFARVPTPLPLPAPLPPARLPKASVPPPLPAAAARAPKASSPPPLPTAARRPPAPQRLPAALYPVVRPKPR